MNKEGSHVGVMLSFVIFITFIIFLFVIFESRINIHQNKESILEHLEKALLERFENNLTIIQSTEEEYNSDYEGLKGELKIPSNVEFAFSFVDEDAEIRIIAEREIPEGINIYTKEILLLYDGKTKAGYLTTKTW